MPKGETAGASAEGKGPSAKPDKPARGDAPRDAPAKGGGRSIWLVGVFGGLLACAAFAALQFIPAQGQAGGGEVREVVTVDTSIGRVLDGWRAKGFSVPMANVPSFEWVLNDTAFLDELFQWGRPGVFRGAPTDGWGALKGPGRWTPATLMDRVGDLAGVRIKRDPAFLYYTRSSRLYPSDPERERAPPKVWATLDGDDRVNVTARQFFEAAGCHSNFFWEVLPSVVPAGVTPAHRSPGGSPDACRDECESGGWGAFSTARSGTGCAFYAREDVAALARKISSQIEDGGDVDAGALTAKDTDVDLHIIVQTDAEAPYLYYSSEVGAWRDAPGVLDGLGPMDPFYGPRADDEGPDDRTYHVWVGGHGVSSQIHYDGAHNFYLQIHGRKRAVLFPPGTHEAWQLFPRLHPHHRQSQVDFFAPDAVKNEAFARAFLRSEGRSAPIPKTGGDAAAKSSQGDARPDGAAAERDNMLAEQGMHGQAVVLEPGDVLYIPPFWLHHMTSLGGAVEESGIGADDAPPSPRCAANVSISVSMWRSSQSLKYFRQAIELPVPMRQGFSSAQRWANTALYVTLFLHESARLMERDVGIESARVRGESVPTLARVRSAAFRQLLETRYARFKGTRSFFTMTQSSPGDPKLKDKSRWASFRRAACALTPDVANPMDRPRVADILLDPTLLAADEGGEPLGPADLERYVKELHETARSAAALVRHSRSPSVRDAAVAERDGARAAGRVVCFGIRYTLMLDYVEEMLKAALGSDNVYPMLLHLERTTRGCGEQSSSA